MQQVTIYTHLSFISWYKFSFMYSNIKYKWSFSRITSLSLITLAWLSFFKDWNNKEKYHVRIYGIYKIKIVDVESKSNHAGQYTQVTAAHIQKHALQL